MASSSLSLFPSSLKKSKKTKISLDALPEDLLVEISSRIGTSSLSAVRNLRLVSKPFRRICNDPHIISRLSLREISLSPWGRNPKKYSKFMKRCRKNGNADALYRKGFLNYFRDNRKSKGLELLAEAAGKENKEAKYVYGLILICLGDKTKQKGFEILSSLLKPSKSTTIKELMELRHKIKEITEDFWDCGNIRDLKTGYVREKCECNVEAKMYAETGCVWHREFCEFCLPTCEFCLWHHEVEHFC